MGIGRHIEKAHTGISTRTSREGLRSAGRYSFTSMVFRSNTRATRVYLGTKSVLLPFVCSYYLGQVQYAAYVRNLGFEQFQAWIFRNSRLLQQSIGAQRGTPLLILGNSVREPMLDVDITKSREPWPSLEILHCCRVLHAIGGH